MEKLVALAGIIYLLAVAWPLSRIDIQEHRLPNRLVLPAFPITLAGQLAAAAISGEWFSLLIALIAAVVALAIGLVANHSAGLGMGDVKLITAITFSLAWFSPLIPLVAVFIAFAVASMVILVLYFMGRSKLNATVALGPYLLVGLVFSLPSLGW